MFKKIVVFIFGVLFFSSSIANVVINEFQAGNSSTIQDPQFHEYSDWIELYNNGTSDVDISGYYLTNKLSDTTRWEFPVGTNIPANSYLIVWADSKYDGEQTTGYHTNFKLNIKGDEIALYSSTKILIDQYTFGVVSSDQSIGRYLSNPTLWRLYSSPTPGAANTTSANKTQVIQPVMSITSGFYPDKQTVTISCPTSGAVIYYTTDGSNPSYSSQTYSSPITITKNTVLKAVASHPDYTNSRIVAQTYFIGERNITIPVVSIGVDSLEMFDDYSGMYSLGPNAEKSDPNYGANFWKDREIPSTFEYFVNGKQKVQVNAGISIHGGWSRRFAQRSFAFHCGNEYGNERMDYQFFPDKKINEFKYIILKNAGCNVNSLKYRDGMISWLAKQNMKLDYQGFQPAVAFINGYYWGILNVQEKLNDNYLKNNYDLDSTEVDMLYNYNEIYAGNSNDFDDMTSFIENSNMSNSSNYNVIANRMDIDEFIDYEIAEIFVANHDWPGYNIRYWRNVNGGKWRWIFYDTDQSMNYYVNASENQNSLNDATTSHGSSWPNPSYSTLILRKLLENTEFKNLFIQRFAAHMNSTFSKDSIINMANSIDKIFAGEKIPHLTRWGYGDSLWNAELAGIKSFAQNRAGKMRGFIKSKFGISSTHTLTLKTENNINPRFKLSGVNLNGNNITGEYFDGIPFTLEALDESGLTFKEWQDDNGTVVSTTKSFTVNSFTSNKTYIAIYDINPKLQNVYINEFMTSNKSIIKDNVGEYEDWIELYNDNDFAVNIAGMYLTDDFSNPYKFQIPINQNNETIIPAKGYLLIW